jgi:hypothetical protein
VEAHSGSGTRPCKVPGQTPFCAPSAIRTRALLLRSNPAADAVANWDDAGHARGGTHCCSPSYLVIASRDTGRTTATEDAPWIVSQEVASSHSSSVANLALPSAPAGNHSAASPGHSPRPRARRLPFHDLVPIHMSVHAAHSGQCRVRRERPDRELYRFELEPGSAWRGPTRPDDRSCM